MTRLIILASFSGIVALSASLPLVSLGSAKWTCSEGTAIENGVATLTGEAKEYRRVFLPLPASAVAGKTLRFSAEVKTQGMKPGQQVVYASPKLKIADGAKGSAMMVNNFGTKDQPEWNEITAEVTVPRDREQPVVLELGLQYCSGTFQARNVTLTEVEPWSWRVLDAGKQAGPFTPTPPKADTADRRPPNVLFIAVDDLKPQLNCYGETQIISPHLDRLAATGMTFTRTYCQQAVCSPSRTSLMTGLRPDSTQVYNLTTHFRKNVPDVVTLPQHFAQNGYATMGMGKIYHGGLNDKPSWNTPAPKVGGAGYVSREVRADQAMRRKEGRKKGLKGVRLYNYTAGPAVENADVPDNAYRDGGLADAATGALKTLAAGDRPFFLAVGFYKPHLPFNAPKRYWDLYERDKVPLARNPNAPTGAPRCAMHTFGELRSYQGVPKKGPVSDAQARELVHAYYACVSFVDAQIGKLLGQLESLGLRDDTVVIVWGDHGWHLGDHGLWCKHTNFESAARVPMILRVPGARSAGSTCDALTEFVDIYPTLCELAGLPLPSHVEGTSLAPLVQDPRRAWKPAAFSQYPRGGGLMGYSMRTPQYRYTEWIRRGGKVEAMELYDHRTDPHENTNLAVLAEHAGALKRLSSQLHKGWRAAKPAQ